MTRREMIHLVNHRAPRRPEVVERRAELRKTEYTFRCELCQAPVYVVRANVWLGAQKTQLKLREQAMRDHSAKTGCAGNRLAPDELDAIGAELFGIEKRGAVADSTGAAFAPTGIRPTEHADAAFSRGIKGTST